MKAVEVLEAAGFETIVFHAIGPGGRAMEQMMKEGIIGAVLDYSTIEVSNEMYHALLAGGPDRLTTAGQARAAAGDLPRGDRGAGLQRAGDRAAAVQHAHPDPPQPADHRRAAEPGGDGRGGQGGRAASAVHQGQTPSS